jgi:Cyclic nucleotide-binding domain
MSVRSLFLNARQRRTLVPDEVIYAEGDAGTHMYGIIEGAVELRKSGAVVARLGPDEVFGERVLIDDHPRDLTAVAVEPPFWPRSTGTSSSSWWTRAPNSRSTSWARSPRACGTTTTGWRAWCNRTVLTPGPGSR